MNPRRTTTGFTLLEIMLAVTILGMISMAIYATWSSALAGWKRSANICESLQRERIVMDTLAELTKSAVFFKNDSGLYDITGTRESQTGNTITFVTGSDLLLPPTEATAAGMRRVTIAMYRDQWGRPFLGISNIPALHTDDAPEPVVHVLSAQVCGFGVRYRDPRSLAWVEQWEEGSLIPSAIEYTVAFGPNDGRTPPVVVTRAVELPIAQFALMAMGQRLAERDTTNTVSRADIELAEPAGGEDF
jgi:prepilin-type N-terminal cleavage/methylation domain-containing protein